MGELLPTLGWFVLLVGIGLPLLLWLVTRFPVATGTIGLVAAVMELVRLLAGPGDLAIPADLDSIPSARIAPGRLPPSDGSGLSGPEIRL